jgi:hypothetical protein
MLGRKREAIAHRRRCGGRREGALEMRLILIDKGSGFIFGDTAAYLAGSSEWSDDVTGDEHDVEALALLAVRLLDDSIGAQGREYAYVSYDPCDTSTGYHVFRADIEGAAAVPVVRDDGQDQPVIDAVKTNCAYLGFVRAT